MIPKFETFRIKIGECYKRLTLSYFTLQNGHEIQGTGVEL